MLKSKLKKLVLAIAAVAVTGWGYELLAKVEQLTTEVIRLQKYATATGKALGKASRTLAETQRQLSKTQNTITQLKKEISDSSTLVINSMEGLKNSTLEAEKECKVAAEQLKTLLRRFR